jgi:hypothetical protein
VKDVLTVIMLALVVICALMSAYPETEKEPPPSSSLEL